MLICLQLYMIQVVGCLLDTVNIVCSFRYGVSGLDFMVFLRFSGLDFIKK